MNYPVETTDAHTWSYMVWKKSVRWHHSNIKIVSKGHFIYIPTLSVQIILFKRWKYIFTATINLYNFKPLISYLLQLYDWCLPWHGPIIHICTYINKDREGQNIVVICQDLLGDIGNREVDESVLIQMFKDYGPWREIRVPENDVFPPCQIKCVTL